jgi:ATP-binding cassette subfamily C (CFTR/MRP) protein 1
MLPILRSFVFLFFILLSSVVELENGKIEIDGYNVRSVGLDVLRRGLALVPQDSTLFLGTLRDNL